MAAVLNLDTALTVALAPLLAAQTVYVRSRALRLPEPSGPRRGVVGQGPDLRLLVIGDSSAAGVGVPDQSQALTQQLARNLGRHRRVEWRLSAKNGATTADAPALLDRLQGEVFDVAYVIFGVNDAKDLRPEHRWRRDLRQIADRLRQDHGAQRIVFSGLPRIQDFPLLPNPLRSILAMRTVRFDRVLQEIARKLDCHHLPLETKLERSGMAEDGFHPGAPIYRNWAHYAAQGISRIL